MKKHFHDFRQNCKVPPKLAGWYIQENLRSAAVTVPGLLCSLFAVLVRARLLSRELLCYLKKSLSSWKWLALFLVDL